MPHSVTEASGNWRLFIYEPHDQELAFTPQMNLVGRLSGCVLDGFFETVGKGPTLEFLGRLPLLARKH